MIKNKKLGTAVLMTFGAVMLNGCASTTETMTEKDIKRDTSRTERIYDHNNNVRRTNVVHSSGLYVSSKSFKIKKNAKLPVEFSKNIALTLPDALPLSSLLEILTTETGLRFYVNPDALGEFRALSGNTAAAAGVDSTTLGFENAGAMSAAGSGDSSPGGAQVSGGTQVSGITMEFDGPLYKLFDVLSTKMNVFWKWENSRVVFHLYESRTFAVNAIPGTTSLLANVEGRSEGGDGEEGGQISSGQVTSVEAPDMSIWKAIEKSIDAMLSPNGKMAVGEVAGEITVTDTPQVLQKVEEYLDNTNEKIAKQVMVRVEVFEVENNRSSEYGVDWNAVYSASSRYGLNVASQAMDGFTGAGALTATILDPSSSWVGSEAFVKALATQGKVSLVTTSSVVTLNGQPAPVQVMEEKAYLKSVSSTTDTDGNATFALEPGVVKSGFAMSVMPRIMNNRELLIQFAMEVSTLNSIESFAAGDSEIQLPERSVKHFLQRVRMRSGQTLMLAGFQKSGNERGYEGLSSEKFWFLGGKEDSARSKKTTVVLITPYMMGK